jgi:glycosyltransferase involved in cell wall biosynthesis
VSRLVFVCQVFHPDESSTSDLFSELLAQLAARGREWEVLSGFPADPKAASACASRELWRGITIRRGGLRLAFKRSLPARALAYASYCLWLAWRLVVCTPSSARILVATNPPFAPILVHVCSWVRGWSFEVMLLDVYPDGLVAIGILSERSWTTKVWRWFNRRALRASRGVLVLGRDMERLCIERYGLRDALVRYTPHWSPIATKAGVPAEQTRMWQRLGLRDEFVVQYSGNMGLWHDMECIVRAAEQLRDDPRVRFLMIGGGRRKEAAERLCGELGLPNMTWLPYQPKEQLVDSLACCHAALISQRAGLEGVAVPCKIYGILASGRAVLSQVPAGSEVALAVAEEACGITTTPGDVGALVAAIRTLAGDRQLAARMGNRAFDAYAAKYTVEAAADTFERVLYGATVATAGAV